MIDFSSFKAVIFDLDGTLLDSMWMWKEIDDIFMMKNDLEITEEFHKAIEGMSFTETAEHFIEVYDLKVSVDELKAEWSQMAEEYYCHHVKTKDGAVELLEKLKSLGIKMGVATSNDRELTIKTLKANSILDYFDAIKTSCEVGKGKPYPYVYLECAHDLRVDPADCIAIEDTEAGLEAGLSAGMTVVSIYDETSEKYHDDMMARSHYFINSFRELL